MRKLANQLLGRKYLLLGVILTLGLILRLYKISNPIADWHSFRQADTSSVSRVYAEEGIDLLHPRYHDLSSIASGLQNPQGWRFVEFPIFNAFQAGLFQIFPVFSLEVWGRLVAIFSSLVSIVFLYLLGKRFLGTAGGLLAALFFAVLPFNIYFSRVILPEPLAVALGLAALWFFVLWTDREKQYFIYLAAGLFALAILVKPFIAFYGIVMIYLAWSKYGFHGMLRQPKLWIFFSLTLIPVFFWRAWMSQYLEGIPHAEWLFNGDGIRFKPSFWWWIFGERIGRLILGGWLLVLLAVGLTKRLRGRYPWFIHAFAFSQFVYFSTVATANVRHDYYQTLSVPAITLVLALGTLTLWNLKALDKTLRRGVFFACLGFGLFFSAFQVREFYKINHPEIITAGKAADKILPKDALVIVPYGGDTAFLYQTQRKGWPYITLPIEEMVEVLGAQYFVSVNFDSQTAEIMEKYKVIERTDEYVIVDLMQQNDL